MLKQCWNENSYGPCFVFGPVFLLFFGAWHFVRFLAVQASYLERETGVRRTMVGKTHCWGVVRAAVTYGMTSLKLFYFPNFVPFSSMLDNDCWAIGIIRRNLETD